MDKMFTDFEKLRKKIDLKCKSLHAINEKYMVCKKGCDECCMNFNLLPIEFNATLDAIKLLDIKINSNSAPNACPFLVDHECQIYEHRPIICRSHGLPILTMDEEGENWELSFCPLNFTNTDEDYFEAEKCYEQDVFNSELYMINQDHSSLTGIDPHEMSDLHQLAERYSSERLKRK
ncbi:MAG TPA: YkgJ family cysteine cluster protein [Prolixibacteraceae bacterium]|nr:hypothetical protein [Bacteroidales bacterium]HUM88474.1 YkgJ family cysteine cluster protein [Prolixibacteraceae bacterium]